MVCVGGRTRGMGENRDNTLAGRSLTSDNSRIQWHKARGVVDMKAKQEKHARLISSTGHSLF